jgi:hypothetical protein
MRSRRSPRPSRSSSSTTCTTAFLIGLLSGYAGGATADIGALRLEPPGVLRTSFRSRSGRTPEGLHFSVADALGRRLVLLRLTSEPERRDLLVPGRHRLQLGGAGTGLEREVEIHAGEETSIEIDLDGGSGKEEW